uniref:Peptidase n=1 Tax=viral metagenome TaxID=1070528 RepID=A0A6C0K7Y4_9ZZZZ
MTSDAFKPGDGFYRYINHKWMEKAKIPDSRSEYGAFDEIKVENDKKIWSILESTKERAPSVAEIPKSHTDHLRFYKYIWTHRESDREEQFIKSITGQLLACCNGREMARMVGWFCVSMVSTFIDVDVEEEKRTPYYMRNTLSPGRLTLPVRYYNRISLHKTPIWLSYVSYVRTCSIELGLPYLYKAIEAETQLASIIGTPTNEDAFKEHKGEGLHTWLPDFLWEDFLNGAGLESHWKQHMWILNDPICLKRLMKWICNANVEMITAVLTLHMLNGTAKYLRPAISQASFNLFRRSIMGEKQPASEKTRFIDDTSDSLPEILCEEFTKIEFSKKKLNELTDMTRRIKEAAVETMRESNILAKRTTSQVVEKIHRMKVTIGSPSVGSPSVGSPSVGSPSENEVANAAYYPDSLLQTKFSIYKAKVRRRLKDVGKPVNRDIHYPCFVVNASYYEEKNHFIIPWGILQEPFYMEDRGLGWNYGGTGATIGHELTHAFDAEGSEYNAHGKFRRWWTRKDRAHFKNQTRKMVEFFNKFTHCGKHLDGEKTLSENWADFGGLLITLRALKKLLGEKGATEAEVKKEIREFFTSYAVSWRDRLRKRAMEYKMARSVHSLAEDRVDRIVPHFQEWVDVFDIKEGDSLFIPVKDRLKFF